MGAMIISMMLFEDQMQQTMRVSSWKNNVA